jgi:hypothetical protein
MFRNNGLRRQLYLLLRVEESLVSSLLAEALGFPLQQYWCICLGKAEKGKRKNSKCPYSLQIFGPTPAKVAINSQGGSNNWPLELQSASIPFGEIQNTYQSGSTNNCQGIKCNSNSSRFGSPYITQRSRDIAHRSRTKYTPKESCDKD